MGFGCIGGGWMDFATYGYGLGVSLSLIVAIGAQNAFVLKQGLLRQHIGWVCAICALSDAVLILAGVYGFGQLLAGYPKLLSVARYGGAVFLLVYGLRSWHQALTQRHSLIAQGEKTTNLAQTLGLCLAFTWLNPHVYLDTVVLLGSIASQFEHKAAFAAGAISGSVGFFFALGYGARLLEPWFRRPTSWQILEAVIGTLMLGLAVRLAWG